MTSPKIEEHLVSNLEAGAIWSLIHREPEQNFISTSIPLKTFKRHLIADKQRAETNGHIRLLNCWLFTLDDVESGYVIFNPAFDREGRYGFYMEDIFVEEEARRNGVGTVIMRSLANRALADGAKFIKWETDERNTRMMEWTQNAFDATRIEELNLDATPLLSSTGTPLTSTENGYLTCPITLYDAADIRNLGITTNEAAVKSEGGLPLVGFITREKEAPMAAVAVTFAVLNYSTFNTSWGVNLEPTNHRDYLSDEQVAQVVKSTVKAIRKYKIPEDEFPDRGNGKPVDTEIRHLRWHSNPNDRVHSVLTENFNLKVRRMTKAEPSTMMLYLMKDQAVKTAGQQRRPA